MPRTHCIRKPPHIPRNGGGPNRALREPPELAAIEAAVLAI
jgi:hypothetical protein